jgi:hypothetical protein
MYDYNPNQLSFKFFWPLTEQIDLPLDYEGCDTREIMKYDGPVFELGPLGTTSINTINLAVMAQPVVSTLQIGSVEIGLPKKPNMFQRLMYKLLGFGSSDKGKN